MVRPIRPPCSAAAVAALALLGLLAPRPLAAAPPPAGECPTIGGEPGRTGGEDAAPLLVKEGMRVDEQGILALKSLLPEEVWRYREIFFFEGMLMEIGPCQRPYPPAASYAAETARNAGRARLDRDGNLRDYVAGAPFPPERIAADDEQAAARWAWNVEKRWRGAGPRGRFRITSLPARMGPVLRFTGDFFVFQVAERADLAASGHRWPGNDEMIWAVGGEFESPFSARGLAWRQFRPPKSERRWREADDVFVYVPALRKMRRAGTPWVDGAFVPRYLVAGQTDTGGGIALGEGAGSINPGAGPTLAVSEDARSGLTGLFLRPNAYVWRLVGEQTVIAPLNAANPGWPLVEERNYGTSGLSVAADRWDVRHAVVIEGALRQRDETLRTVTLYVDWETFVPLYWISRTDGRRLVEIGILVHRYSGDVPEYPNWTDGSPARVFEPVAASFADVLSGRGGWLRESYALRSVPYDDAERLRMSTNHALQRGH